MLVLTSELTEPAWFAHAMTRALASIREDIAKLNETTAKLVTNVDVLSDKVDILGDKFDILSDKVTESDDHLKASCVHMNQIRRIAAMVESCSFLLLFFSNTDLESSCRDSCEPCLEVVSFASGDHPTAAPVCVFNSFLHDVWLKQLSQHNLPPLSTVNEVQNLTVTLYRLLLIESHASSLQSA